MKQPLEDHASRFDEIAPDYDGDRGPEYEAAVSLVVEHADPGPDERVLDVGTGTGAIALALAGDARQVVGRDISEGMLERAREKAADRGVSNVEFGEGRFREPNVPDDLTGSVDVVTSNFAMHHLGDDEKREAISALAALGPRQIVLGDVMLFGEADPSESFFDPAVDDPATVGVLADALTDEGYALTAVELIHEQVGVLVAERLAAAGSGGGEAA